MSFRIAEQVGEQDQVAVIKVFGVGGGGGNAVNTMIRSGLESVHFIVANTDMQALRQSLADVVLQLGVKTTKGLGAGADPEVGHLAALESIQDIKDSVEKSDLVFIAAGLGGGTGTGAAPMIAQAARDTGAVTVGVVTKPFGFEGKNRHKVAEKGWQSLRKCVDIIITVPNNRLLALSKENKKKSFKDMLTIADGVLLQAVQGIADIINKPGMINADFADVRTAMKEEGPAIMGIGRASGENRGEEAARRAIDNHLLEDTNIDGARGAIINISASGESLTMEDIDSATEFIQSQMAEDANIVFGALTDDDLADEVQVTVIITGIEDRLDFEAEQTPKEEKKNAPRNVAMNPRMEASINGVKAPKNPSNDAAILPRSNFDSMEGLEGSDFNDAYGGGSEWTDEQVQTPAYLRRKAN